MHSTTGELLRSLPGPSDCCRPRLLLLSSEGHIAVNYVDGNGQLAVFAINGIKLSSTELEEQTLVSISPWDTGGIDPAYE